MNEVKCYTHYDRPSIDECPFEEHADEGQVERDGYMTTEQIVEQLIQSGERLIAFKEGRYQADEIVPDDDEPAPLLNDLDLMYEAGRQVKKVEERFKELEAEAMALMKEKEKENEKGDAAETAASEE